MVHICYIAKIRAGIAWLGIKITSRDEHIIHYYNAKNYNNNHNATHINSLL